MPNLLSPSPPSPFSPPRSGFEVIIHAADGSHCFEPPGLRPFASLVLGLNALHALACGRATTRTPVASLPWSDLITLRGGA